MRMITFKQALIESVAPRLKLLGYEYNDALRDRNLRYGFYKLLDNGVYVLIMFDRQQREERPLGYGFTVELIRCKTANLEKWSYSDILVSGRLSLIIWFVFGLQIYSQYDYWWIPTKADELVEQFSDVIDKLEKYGIPWIEDTDSIEPWKMPIYKQREFRDALHRFVSPELNLLGYGTKEFNQHNQPPYYAKKLDTSLYGLIEFLPVYNLDPPRLEFDILLQRKEAADPADYSHVGQLYATLSMLLHFVYNLEEFPSPRMLWEYADSDELVNQLHNVLILLKRYAIPWLEDPLSDNPEL